MRVFIALIIITFWAAACKPKHEMQTTLARDTIISIQELTEIIDTLSSDYFEGRATGSAGIDKAAMFIQNYLAHHNLRPFFEYFRDSFDTRSYVAYNVIGMIEGTDEVLKNEYIILSAHYDHIGKRKGGPDSVYNGANDNATGVSTVLNIAKILAENKLNKRSVIVALFSAEELGLLGAEYFAGKMNYGKKSVYCAVNVDMIGSVFNKKPGKVYLSGYKKSNMAEVFNRYIGSEEVLYWKNEEAFGIFQLSDNYPIYETLQIPSHTFCTFDFSNYDHYHRLSDEIANVDIENTLSIANHIKQGFIKIAASSEREIVLTTKQE